MNILNTSREFTPNFETAEPSILLAVLTQDAVGEHAVYAGITTLEESTKEVTAQAIAHSGQKYSYRRAVCFFPDLNEAEYRR